MSFSAPEEVTSTPRPYRQKPTTAKASDSWPDAAATVTLFTLPLFGLYLGWLEASMLSNNIDVLRIALAMSVISSAAGVVAAKATETWSYCIKTTVRGLSLTGFTSVIAVCLTLKLT